MGVCTIRSMLFTVTHWYKYLYLLLNSFVVLFFKEFERSETAGTESSWFMWFKTEYELAKFERSLLEAWQELFQVCVSITQLPLFDLGL